MKESLVLLSASLAVSCTVSSLPSEGRSCASNDSCAAGLWCDPASKRCTARSVIDAGIDQARLDLDLGKTDILDGPVDVVDAIDTGPVAHLVCDPPELVVTTPRDGSRKSPSLRADGLTLIARESNTGLLQASRASIGDAFGEWKESALSANYQDLTFFFRGNDPVWIMSIREGTAAERHLEICDGTPLNPICVSLALDDALAPITIDVDGPSIADDTSPLVLVFNAKVAESPGVAYIATPANAELTSWSAPRLTLLDTHDVDDPVISPDGTIVLFGDNNNYDLWSIRREAIDQPFSAPQRLSINDAVAEDTEPELGTLPSGKLELFFRSDRGGDGTTSDIYRSVCMP